MTKPTDIYPKNLIKCENCFYGSFPLMETDTGQCQANPPVVKQPNKSCLPEVKRTGKCRYFEKD